MNRLETSSRLAGFKGFMGGALLGRASVLLASRVFGNVFALGYTFVLAGLAAPADFGLAMAAFAWAMLGSIVLSANVEAGSIKHLVGYQVDGAADLASGFVRFSRWVVLAITGAVAGISGLAYLVVGGAALGDVVPVLGLALVIAPLNALTRVFGQHAIAMGQIVAGSLPLSVVRPAVICGLCGIYLVGDIKMDAADIMLLFLVGTAVTALAQAVWLRTEFAKATAPAPAYGPWRGWLRTGVMLSPLLVLRDNLKHVVVAAAALGVAATQVGELSLALSVMSVAYFGKKAVDIANGPRLSKAVQTGDIATQNGLLVVAAKIKCAALIVELAAVAVLGPWFFTLIGDQYTSAAVYTLILMAIPAADAIFGPTQQVLNVSGNQDKIFVIAGLSAIALAVATALGGILWGGMGAATGASVAYVIQQMALWRTCRNSAGIETSILCLYREN